MMDPSLFASRRTRGVTFHLCACGVALIILLQSVVRFLSQKPYPDGMLDLNEWAFSFYYPDTMGRIVGYCLFLAIGFSYFLASYLILNAADQSTRLPFFSWVVATRRRSIFFALALLAINLGLALVSSFFRAKAAVPLSTFLWFVSFLFPLCAPILRKTRPLVSFKATGVLFVVTAVVFGWVFYPFIFGPHKMTNEFLAISEQTLLSEPSGSRRTVLNAQFIRDHNIYGLRPYVYERDGKIDPEPKTEYRVRVRPTSSLRQFLERNRALEYMANVKENVPHRFFFDLHRQELVAADALTTADINTLSSLINENDRPQLAVLDSKSNREAHAALFRVLTEEEREFTRNNQLELHWQIFNRWVIHHHNFVLGPINEYACGKPPSQINLQYGWLNIVGLKNLLDFMGGITYSNYLRAFYSFYVIYYAIFGGVAFWLLRDRPYVALLAIATVCVYLVIGFQFLFLGPGLNPIRHFFDIPVLATLAAYLRRQQKVWLLLGCPLLVLSVLNNTETGLFLTLALTATLGVCALSHRSCRQIAFELSCVLPPLIFALYWSLFGQIGQRHMEPYYLRGFLGFPPTLGTSVLLGGILAGYFLFLKLRKSLDVDKYLFLFLLLYSQALLIYYVWGGTRYHFLNFAPIYILMGILGLRLFLANFPKETQEIVVGTSLACSLLVLAGGIIHYIVDKAQYDRVFTTHVVHPWNFPTARFLSTMDPKPFEDAVSRVQRYSTTNPSIHIISKYDSILPFIAERYSAMPFFEVSPFLLSEKEIQLCVDTILRDAPEFLFVDTDIERPHLTEIVQFTHGRDPEQDGLHEESLIRIQRLHCLTKVYQRVAHAYEPVEEGPLISVYRRKSAPPK